MALKAVLQNLDGVPDALRSEYKEHEGKFYLDIEGVDDHHAIGALRRAKDYEKDEARKAKSKVTDLTTQLETLQNDLNELRKNGIPKGDVEALETSYKTKYAAKEAELTGKIESLSKSLESHLLDGNAVKIATEIAAKPEYIELLLPHIRHRLKLEESEGQSVVRILDKDGKPSASNLEDLKKELLGNKAFGAILAGSKATGGGANGGGGGGAPSGKKLSEMTEAERVKWFREDPEGFKRAKAEQDGAAASK